MTAFSTAGNEQRFSNDESEMPRLSAKSFKCFGFGTTNATTKCFDDSPYTQILSTIGHVFSSASTLPNETYSPACNLTKSFLRSEMKTTKIGHWKCYGCKFNEHENHANSVRLNVVLWSFQYIPMILRTPSSWNSPMSPVLNHLS